MPNAELPMLFVQINSRIRVDPSMENQAVILLKGRLELWKYY